MTEFMFYAPTRVLFGEGAEEKAGEWIAEGGFKKALVLYGGGSVQKSGLLARVCASLDEAKVQWVELGGVKPNPRLGMVYEGIELCKAEAVDFLLAVGGGSVIDCAKAIGYGLANEGDVWDYYMGKKQVKGAAPVGAIPTIAAAGSEMSDSSVITDERTGSKRGLSTLYGYCRFALMNPALTCTLPAYQTACGCADIMMHTLERYFTPHSALELTDALAEALMRNVMDNARKLARDGKDVDARAEMMWAGTLSHNGVTGDRALGDWACHQLGHELSARYDLAHGASLSALFGSWARYVYKAQPARFAQLAVNVLELPEEGSVEEMALAGIEEMEGFFWALELPTNMAEADIQADEHTIEELAAGCSRGGSRTIGAFKVLNEEDMRAIYRTAKG